jgi:DNA-binding CsgD family transcriptional regulator
LVQRDQDVDGEPRFRMLETIREYAVERLAASGEAEATHRVHAAWFLDLAERAQPELTKPNAGAWLDRLDREDNNLRVALAWLELDDLPGFLRLAAALGRFWDYRGQLTEGRGWLARALDSVRVGGAPTPAFAEAASCAGLLALRQGDYDDARVRVEVARAAWQGLGNLAGVARALLLLGAVAEYQGNDEEAEVVYEEALTACREAGDIAGLAIAYDNLSDVAFRRDDHARAASLATDGRAAARESRFPARIAAPLVTLGQAVASLGERPRAVDAYRESLQISREFGYAIGVAEALAGLADVAAAAGDPRQAVRLLGAVAEIAETQGVPRLPHETLLRRAVAAARAALDEPTFAVAWAEGRTLTIEQAMAEALDLSLLAVAATSPTGFASPSRSAEASITARQAQILPLLAAGRTDREIAGELYLSHRTVEHHVARLAARLGVQSRAAIVGAAYAAGLLDSGQWSPRE